MSNNLPKGWIETTLGEIAEWASGGTPKATESKYYGGDIPWLIIGDLNDGEVYKSAKTITKLGLENSSAKIAPINSVLIAMYGSIGKLGIAKIECATNQAIAFTQKIYGNIPYKLLYYYLFSIREDLLKQGKGGAQQNISQTVLKEVSFPLPPLPEQQRIVEKLDALMARINNSKARLEKIPTLLKSFRQSVLAAAVSGELTKKWREENKLEPVTSCNEFDKKSFIGYDDLPNTWSWLMVEDYLINLDKGRIPVSQEIRKTRKGEYPYYGATGIIDNIDGFTHDGELILLSEDGMNLIYRTKPQALIATGKIWVNNHAHVLKSKDGFENMYAVYCFNTIDLSPYLTGIDQVKLTQGNLNKIPLPIPPKEEQKEIVRKVEELFHFADSIEARYQKAKAWFDKLPQALLAKAFRGELVAQNKNDEPASELLKRIHKEKHTISKPPKTTVLKTKRRKDYKVDEDEELRMVAEE